MITPELTVAALVERNGRFLMVEEVVREQTVLNQPAGHVEYGESALDAVVRETREETAWRFTPTALVGTYLWRIPSATRHVMRILFTGDVSDHDSDSELDDGIIATHWMDYRALQAAEERLRTPLVLHGLDDYLAGRRLPLDAVRCFDYTGTPR
ncbi:NUDIX hydrolase [Salinisphaera sp. P385]|uniref:Phosphatase NudJ n=1 Tax=Spectribacter acetivorans TaxID=3075603 RepID=A0ABU3B5Q5_9GAMM|nr:NUDIX hydrolase [Salinisphaera sp. P385]MDT0617564.1 NUDIX hydrolase [Salinisphaera sp. P385]